jgi:hypothetical protein
MRFDLLYPNFHLDRWVRRIGNPPYMRFDLLYPNLHLDR